MTVRRILAVAALLIGLAIGIILWDILVYIAVEIGTGPHATAFAAVPSGVVLLGIVGVTAAFISFIRHRNRGLRTLLVVVWICNLVSYSLFFFFPSL